MFLVVFLRHCKVPSPLLPTHLREGSAQHTSSEGQDSTARSTESPGQTWHWPWHGAYQAWAVCSREQSGWFQLEVCLGGKRFAIPVLWSGNQSFKTSPHFTPSNIPPDLSQTFKILLDAWVYFLHLHEFYIILHVQNQSIKNTVLCPFPSSSVKENKVIWYIWWSSPFGLFSEVITVLKCKVLIY